jgi:hypothetical protein
MINVKVKEIVKYDGHSVSANGSVNFNIKASYSELVKTISVMQMLNNDVNIKVKLPGNKPMRIGIFRIKQIVIDGDGESKIKFNGLNDFIEMDNLNKLPLNSDEMKEFTVLMEAEVEEEGKEEAGDE